jgi:tryptophan 2,3-dioxygenase
MTGYVTYMLDPKTYGLYAYFMGAGTNEGMVAAHLSGLPRGMQTGHIYPVEVGQVMGISGGKAGSPLSGNSTGPHAHFTTWQGDRITNPTPFVSGAIRIDPNTLPQARMLAKSLAAGKKVADTTLVKQTVPQAKQGTTPAKRATPGAAAALGYPVGAPLPAMDGSAPVQVQITMPEAREAAKPLSAREYEEMGSLYLKNINNTFNQLTVLSNGQTKELQDAQKKVADLAYKKLPEERFKYLQMKYQQLQEIAQYTEQKMAKYWELMEMLPAGQSVMIGGKRVQGLPGNALEYANRMSEAGQLTLSEWQRREVTLPTEEAQHRFDQLSASIDNFGYTAGKAAEAVAAYEAQIKAQNDLLWKLGQREQPIKDWGFGSASDALGFFVELRNTLTHMELPTGLSPEQYTERAALLLTKQGNFADQMNQRYGLKLDTRDPGRLQEQLLKMISSVLGPNTSAHFMDYVMKPENLGSVTQFLEQLSGDMLTAKHTIEKLKAERAPTVSGLSERGLSQEEARYTADAEREKQNLALREELARSMYQLAGYEYEATEAYKRVIDDKIAQAQEERDLYLRFLASDEAKTLMQTESGKLIVKGYQNKVSELSGTIVSESISKLTVQSPLQKNIDEMRAAAREYELSLKLAAHTRNPLAAAASAVRSYLESTFGKVRDQVTQAMDQQYLAEKWLSILTPDRLDSMRDRMKQEIGLSDEQMRNIDTVRGNLQDVADRSALTIDHFSRELFGLQQTMEEVNRASSFREGLEENWMALASGKQGVGSFVTGIGESFNSLMVEQLSRKLAGTMLDDFSSLFLSPGDNVMAGKVDTSNTLLGTIAGGVQALPERLAAAMALNVAENPVPTVRELPEQVVTAMDQRLAPEQAYSQVAAVKALPERLVTVLDARLAPERAYDPIAAAKQLPSAQETPGTLTPAIGSSAPGVVAPAPGTPRKSSLLGMNIGREFYKYAGAMSSGYSLYSGAANGSMSNDSAMLSGAMSGWSMGEMLSKSASAGPIGALVGIGLALFGLHRKNKDTLEKIYDQMPKRRDIQFAAPSYLPFSAYAGGRGSVYEIHLHGGAGIETAGVEQSVRRAIEQAHSRGVAGRAVNVVL